MSLRNERAAPRLGIIEPCLPSPAKAPLSGPGWLHEIKHDGFRILARRNSAGARLITRNGNDFSSRFPFIAMAVGKLPVRSCLIDGEAVYRAACQLGCEGIVSKRLGSTYRRGRSPLWLKVKNPSAPAVKREAEEDWGF
jgi:bifunctional non-homologous end joining protein LigD